MLHDETERNPSCHKSIKNSQLIKSKYYSLHTITDISRSEIENTLGIGKTRFFALLKQCRDQPNSFSIDYRRQSKSRLSIEEEDKIREELQRDKQLVEDNELPISSYNYAAVTDRLKKAGVKVSTTTVIKRAIQYDCYLPKKKKKEWHDRELLTSAIGDLIQHDASIHKWSPYAAEKWTLITSLDDFSRMRLILLMLAHLFQLVSTLRAAIQFGDLRLVHLFHVRLFSVRKLPFPGFAPWSFGILLQLPAGKWRGLSSPRPFQLLHSCLQLLYLFLQFLNDNHSLGQLFLQFCYPFILRFEQRVFAVPFSHPYQCTISSTALKRVIQPVFL